MALIAGIPEDKKGFDIISAVARAGVCETCSARVRSLRGFLGPGSQAESTPVKNI
jgi:hypothetical protein